MTVALWFALGVAVGVAQGLSLFRSAVRGRSALGFLFRVALVGAALTVAAIEGHPLAAALGWMLGHAASVVAMRRRLR